MIRTYVFLFRIWTHVLLCRSYKNGVHTLFQEFASNANENVEKRVLIIKREKKAIVKDEKEMTDYPCQLEYVKCKDLAAQVAELATEKAAIIEQLVAIKGDNQNLHLKSKRHEDDSKKLKGTHAATAVEPNAKITNLENKLKVATQSRTD